MTKSVGDKFGLVDGLVKAVTALVHTGIIPRSIRFYEGGDQGEDHSIRLEGLSLKEISLIRNTLADASVKRAQKLWDDTEPGHINVTEATFDERAYAATVLKLAAESIHNQYKTQRDAGKPAKASASVAGQILTGLVRDIKAAFPSAQVIEIGDDDTEETLLAKFQAQWGTGGPIA